MKAPDTETHVWIESNRSITRLEMLREEWHPVCTMPCDQRVPPAQTYRLGGEGLVPSDPFALRSDPTRLRAKMGSTTERTAAEFLIGFGVVHIATTLALLVGSVLVKQESGFVPIQQALQFGASVTAGASLFAFIPGAIMWARSSTSVEDLSPHAFRPP